MVFPTRSKEDFTTNLLNKKQMTKYTVLHANICDQEQATKLLINGLRNTKKTMNETDLNWGEAYTVHMGLLLVCSLQTQSIRRLGYALERAVMAANFTNLQKYPSVKIKDGQIYTSDTPEDSKVQISVKNLAQKVSLLKTGDYVAFTLSPESNDQLAIKRSLEFNADMAVVGVYDRGAIASFSFITSIDTINEILTDLLGQDHVWICKK